jgi:uncharacterized membrane protein SpoIIM required for sporulation/ABC-type transport system involved in multi-copper enzyme maturation permease subunit
MFKRWKGDLEMVWLVAWRELKDQLRDWRILFPMIVLTLVLPFLADYGAKAAIDFTTKYGTPIIAERLVPFLLMVVGFFPITVSLIIALESFVGEKERGTIEPLLCSPLKDWQLFMGKSLAGTAAPLVTSYIGITVYMIGLHFQHIAFPDINRIAQTIILTTVQAFLMVSGAILISTQATSVRASSLMASFIIIPMALLIQGESVLLFWGTNQVLWWAVLGVIILAILLARVGIAHFQREALLGREIDVLNLKWIAKTFIEKFKGGATSVKHWYVLLLKNTMKKELPTLIVTLILGIGTAVVGYILMSQVGNKYPVSYEPGSISQWVSSGIGIPFNSFQFSFMDIWRHNLGAIVMISLLGLFSFGILGILLYLLNLGVIGAVLGLVGIMGLSPFKIALFGLLPHGIFEISALVLSGMAILHIGVVLVTPNPKMSLGEVMIESLADLAKIGIGLVFPLLTIAAAVETWITPMLLSSVIRY